MPKNKVSEHSSLKLRPLKLDEFIGQEKLKRQLRIFIEAAKKRKEPLEHIMFYGPPGLGKTTLARLLAHEIGVNIKITSGPVLERAGDLASILTSLKRGDILFIDEIHRLKRVIEETLYPAMEDFCLDLIIGKGPAAKTLRLNLEQFTVIGATTRIGSLSSPMRDRFGLVQRISFYSEESLQKIVKRSAQILRVKIDEQGVKKVACRSRGTPRIANRILRRIRDFAQIEGKGKITAEIAKKALIMLAVDDLGLTRADRKLLKALAEKHQGGPVGVETLAATISEDVETIEAVYEPYLLQIGFLKRTPRGRVLTPSAFKFLGLELPEKFQQKLF